MPPPVADAGPVSAAERRHLLLLVAAAVLLVLPMILLDRLPCNDTAGRYAPTVADFAAGRWRQAFHPRIQPLLTVAGGCLAAIGLPPFIAVKTASTLFFAAGLVPLYLLQRTLFGAQPARVAAWLYLLCPALLRYAGLGLRDPPNTFALLVAFMGLVRFQAAPGRAAALWTAAGAAGMALARGEMLPFALLCITTLVALDLFAGSPNGVSRLHMPRHSLAGAALFTVLLLPWVAHATRMTGYPVTASQQVSIWRRIEWTTGHAFQVTTPVLPLDWYPWSPLIPVAPVANPAPHMAVAGEILDSVFAGLVPYYLLPAVAAAVWRRRQRQWRPGEWILVLGVAAHVTLLVASVLASGSTIVSKRYVTSVMPLMLGWTALALIAVRAWLDRHRPRLRPLFTVAAVGISITLVWDGTSNARPRWRQVRRDEDRAVQDCARWLREQKADQPARFARTGLPLTARAYRTGTRPLVLGGTTVLTWLCGGEHLGWMELGYPPLTAEELANLGAAWSVDYIAWDRELIRLCPELRDLDRLPPPFQVVYDAWRDIGRPLVILELAPASLTESGTIGEPPGTPDDGLAP
jgi:4-amino-4-deoxy-L-arabinose transferase-like glycosyltransferase